MEKGSSAKYGNYSFSHPCVIQNILDLLYSVEHRKDILKDTFMVPLLLFLQLESLLCSTEERKPNLFGMT